jgi:hypothetical protein
MLLVYGCCNPSGECEEHKGVYLRKSDISSIVSSGALHNLPVKIEHTGRPVGHIVSAWQNGEKLDCVLRIDDDSIDSIFAQEFIKSRKCPELSMSYSVVMEHSESGLSGEKKELIEVSIVQRGARPDCTIVGFSTK